MGNGKHFEDIWNEAERVAGIMLDSDHDLGSPIGEIRHVLDIARNGYTLSVGYDEQTATKLVGDILWQLCAFCKLMESQGKSINSALALRLAINDKKTNLLDPDDDKE